VPNDVPGPTQAPVSSTHAPASSPPIPARQPGAPDLAILVDYDGTIALTDVSDTITGAMLPADLERELAVLYDTGRAGSREIMQREIDLLPPDPAAVNALVAAQPHDPSFASFVRAARAAAIPVEIVSDGFGFFIGPAMERLGVRDLVTIVTAETTFDGGRPRIAFPNGHPACFVCGTCKRNRVLGHRAAGRAVVFIGDGESDRYAAGYSDFVFAKRALVRICEGYGWPFARWDRFAEIEDWLAARMAAFVTTGQSFVERRETRFFCGPEAWGPGLTAPPVPFSVVGGETAPVGEPETGARP
jgi:2-hydroxy-3-keto-5-methylthiopentenyl-1-phosphate phosphatase